MGNKSQSLDLLPLALYSSFVHVAHASFEGALRRALAY